MSMTRTASMRGRGGSMSNNRGGSPLSKLGPKLITSNDPPILSGLDTASGEFIDENGWPGVRLRKPQQEAYVSSATLKNSSKGSDAFGALYHRLIR
jgi:hypothetical protein